MQSGTLRREKLENEVLKLIRVPDRLPYVSPAHTGFQSTLVLLKGFKECVEPRKVREWILGFQFTLRQCANHFELKSAL